MRREKIKKNALSWWLVVLLVPSCVWFILGAVSVGVDRADTVRPQWVLPVGCGGTGGLYASGGVDLLVCPQKWYSHQ